MPIYEYRCQDCGRKLSVFWRSRADVKTPTCRRCGSDNMMRLVSRVRVLHSEERRMENLADESMLAGLDEEDPRSLGRWMRKMSREMGEELDPEMEEVVSRLEAGQDPEEIEKSVPGLSEAGGSDFAPSGDFGPSGGDFVSGSEF
ncbi:MAG: zinc ribbon domain-containing protein [Anaerolineae bacterium]|jgi:putative FmdB family regulatory protein